MFLSFRKKLQKTRVAKGNAKLVIITEIDLDKAKEVTKEFGAEVVASDQIFQWIAISLRRVHSVQS